MRLSAHFTRSFKSVRVKSPVGSLDALKEALLLSTLEEQKPTCPSASKFLVRFLNPVIVFKDTSPMFVRVCVAPKLLCLVPTNVI